MIKYKNKQIYLTGKSYDEATVGVRIHGEGHKTYYVSVDQLTVDSEDELRTAIEAAPKLVTWAVVDADGHYGDQTTVYATSYDRSEAWGYAVHHLPAQLICGADLEVGQKIRRTSIGSVYRAVQVP